MDKGIMGKLRYFSVVFGELGEILIFISPLTLLPLLVAILFGEWDLLLPLATVPFLFFTGGVLLDSIPRHEGKVRFSAALCSVALVWLTFALVSCIPFMIVLDIPFSDALFETMAGWTGTGFTLLQNIASLPKSLLFWRTYMQWLGGLAIISLSLTVAFQSSLEKYRFSARRAGQNGLSRASLPMERDLGGVHPAHRDICRHHHDCQGPALGFTQPRTFRHLHWRFHPR